MTSGGARPGAGRKLHGLEKKRPFMTKIDPGLLAWLDEYSKASNTPKAQIVAEALLKLKKEVESK